MGQNKTKMHILNHPQLNTHENNILLRQGMESKQDRALVIQNLMKQTQLHNHYCRYLLPIRLDGDNDPVHRHGNSD